MAHLRAVAANSRRARIIVWVLSVVVAALTCGVGLRSRQQRWMPSNPAGATPRSPPRRGGEGIEAAPAAGSRSPHHPSSSLAFYTTMRPDRAGAVLQDMLVAHAYAWTRNLTYLGACPPAPPSSPPSGGERGRRSTPRLTAEQVTELIALLGLDDVLRIACPPPPPPGTSNLHEEGHEALVREGPVVDRKFYSRHNVRVCTTEWQRYMRAKVQRRKPGVVVSPEASSSAPPRAPPRAVVHIRRGDVTPCDPRTSERYLPNSYYQDLLHMYVPAHFQVTIYSERTSVEPWDDFANDSYTLRLGGNGNGDGDHDLTGEVDSASTSSSTMQDLARIWLDMMTADVVILSKSSFSVVPALLCGGAPSSNEPPQTPTSMSPGGTPRIIYTDFWIDPLPHWTRVPQSLQREAVSGAERVKNERCLK